MKIIDIHTHIVYGIDDGAADLDESLKLMGLAYEQGVRGIFCTNHSYGMSFGENYKKYHDRFEELREKAAEKYPGLGLYKGCEVLCYKDEMPEIMERVYSGMYPSMNGTKCLLMEFDPKGTRGMDEACACAQYALDSGYVPIIAHAERYNPFYDDPLQDVIRLREMGCLVQINLYSVEQDRSIRKELANLFLKHHQVDLVGTDTHSLTYKRTEGLVGAEALERKYGKEYAEEVLWKKGERMIGVDKPIAGGTASIKNSSCIANNSML